MAIGRRRSFIVSKAHPYNKIGDGPEGPEVRTVADKIRPVVTGQVITSYFIGKPHKLTGFDTLRCPATILEVQSYGKKILLHLDSGQSIIIALGMSGRLQYQDGGHTHVRFDLSQPTINGMLRVLRPNGALYYDQSRPFAGIDIIPSSTLSGFFSTYGPDLLQCALTTWIPSDYWLAVFRRKKIVKWHICQALLDQELVAGIGNYLKSEILYYAGVHPSREMQSLTDDELEKIRECAHQVIALAYAHRGFTIKSYISPDGEMGVYPAAVYGKTVDPYGRVVIKIPKTKDGRASYYVAEVQRAF